MPPGDMAIAAAHAPTEAIPQLTTALSGWGGGAKVPVTMIRPRSTQELVEAVASAPAKAAIARGGGRSYGDAAQLRDGLVVELSALDAYKLDADAGVLTAQTGTTLGRLLPVLASRGWALPVVPGTQHVTVGGAIAGDVHGKNHREIGTFGAHVLALGLVTASGEILELTPDQGGELLATTIGGMGLTGVILWARIKLRRLSSAWLSVDTDRVQTLDAALSALDEDGGAHRVAWLDLLGDARVRGVVTRAEHLTQDPAGDHAGALTTVAARIGVPSWWPGGLLRPGTVRAYNDLRFRRAPHRQRGQLEPFGRHMFPLDALSGWPRLYGRHGFVQYQCVVPRGRERTLESLIADLRRSPVPCYLAVLKDLGAENRAPLSFPLAGWTLALDMPRKAAGLEPLMQRFDEHVAEAGGRVYLSKDSRLAPDVLAAMYPRLQRWRDVRDQADPEGRWRSDLGIRTGLVAAG